MKTVRYRIGNRYAATAKALLLYLPPIGDPTETANYPTTTTGYQALGEFGALVADAITPRVYSSTGSEVLSPLLFEVAARLLAQSKSLDADFYAVVDREFWNLL
jgi:hypothetical protein